MASAKERSPESDHQLQLTSSGCPDRSKSERLSSDVHKKLRLYPMSVSSSSSVNSAMCFSVGRWVGLRRQACLLGGLAAFQMVAVVTIIVSALSEAGNGGGARLKPSSIASSGSDFSEPSSFFDRLSARFGGLAWGVPPPSATEWRRLDELNVTDDQGITTETRRYVDELNVTLIELQSAMYGADCVETFLLHYEKFCESAFVPGTSGGEWTSSTNGTSAQVPSDEPTIDEVSNSTKRRWRSRSAQLREKKTTLCPCVPRDRLIGRTKPMAVNNGDEQTADDFAVKYGLDRGGHWSPGDCVARQRLAVIIPFRDREKHLQTLLRVLHPMLQRQLVDYTIFVVEQDLPKDIFNKASLMNAGFIEAKAQGAAGANSGPFDCFLFHDVDMLPEDDRNFYGCGARLPRHVGAYIDKWNYNLMYYRIFGGATSFRPEVFELINGYSNEFYGWGGEDDDILNRIESKNLTFVRFPKCVAPYSMIKHDADKRNPYNKASVVAWQRRPTLYEQNGLNSLRYKLVGAERRALYTWLLITLPPPAT